MKIINTKTFSGQRFIPEDKDYERVEQYKSADDMMNEILKIKDLDKLCRRCIACIMGTGFGRNIHVWVERAKQLGADDTVINDLKDAIIDAFTETTDSDITIQSAQLAAKIAKKENTKGQFYPEGIPYFTLDLWLDQRRNSYENTGKVYINFLKEGNVLRPVTYCGQGKSGNQFTVACVANAPIKTIGDLKEELHKGYKGLVAIELVNSAGRELAISDALNMYFLDGNLILSNNESQISSLESAEIATLEEKPVQLDTIRRDHVSPDMSTFSYLLSKSPLRFNKFNLKKEAIKLEDLKEYVKACKQIDRSKGVSSRMIEDLSRSFPVLSKVLHLAPAESYIAAWQEKLDRNELYILVEANYSHAFYNSPQNFYNGLETCREKVFAGSNVYSEFLCKNFALVKYQDYADQLSKQISSLVGTQPVYEGAAQNLDYCIGFDIEGGVALYCSVLGYIPSEVRIKQNERHSASESYQGQLYSDLEDAVISGTLSLVPGGSFYDEYKDHYLDIDFSLNGSASQEPSKPTTARGTVNRPSSPDMSPFSYMVSKSPIELSNLNLSK